jgi:hypothetical protein
LVDRVIAIRDRAGVAPGQRSWSYYLRAKIAWATQRPGEALADLRQAMLLAEQQREHASGAEHERAESFGSYSTAFELMVSWQVELGDVGQAVEAIERARARSLLDELSMAGADLEMGRSAAERERLGQRETELKQRIAGLKRRRELIAESSDTSAESTTETLESLDEQLADAEAELYQHYRDQRNTNPVYRNLLSTGSGPLRLSQIRRRVVGDDGLLLIYMLGSGAGFVVMISPDEAKVLRLAVDEPTAEILEMIDPGPLTDRRLRMALVNLEGTGVMQQLRDPLLAAKPTD